MDNIKTYTSLLRIGKVLSVKDPFGNRVSHILQKIRDSFIVLRFNLKTNSSNLKSSPSVYYFSFVYK